MMVKKVARFQQCHQLSWIGGGAYLPLLWLPRTPPASTANIRQGKAPEEPPLCFSGKLNCQQSVIVTAKLTTQITLLAEAVFLWGNRPLSTDSYTETYWDLSSFKACCVFTGRGLHCLWIQGLSCLCALLMFYGNSILCFPPLVCWSDADVPCMRLRLLGPVPHRWPRCCFHRCPSTSLTAVSRSCWASSRTLLFWKLCLFTSTSCDPGHRHTRTHIQFLSSTFFL